MQAITAQNIAIVDDEIISAKILGKHLENLGHQVNLFNSGEEFLSHLEHETPDLVFMDIVMEGISGHEVLECVRKQYTSLDLPIIMLSSNSENADIIQALQLGANDYITKPADPHIVQARVETQLNLKHFYQKTLKQKEFETLKSLIITYNHEINTPLSIAMCNLPSKLEDLTAKKFENSKEALNRIAEITNSIRNLLDREISYQNYANNKMYDLKKSS